MIKILSIALVFLGYGCTPFFAVAADSSTSVEMMNMVPGLPVTSKVRSIRVLRFENVVRQERDFTCGAAALATILKNVFGKSTTELEIIEDMLKNTDEKIAKERGFSLLDMKNYVERVGLRGRGYKIDAAGLISTKIPVIALQVTRGIPHFVVVRKVVDGIVYVADPALGNRIMPVGEFVEGWNGIIFAVLGSGLNSDNALAAPMITSPLRLRSAIVTLPSLPLKDFGIGMDSF